MSKKANSSAPSFERQPGFYKYASIVVVVAVLGNFIYANVGTDLKNLHYTYISDVWGWARTSVQWPTTIGTLLGLPCGLWLGRWTAKYGGRKIGAPSFLVLGLSLIGVAISAANGSYPLYFLANVIAVIAQSAMYLAIYAMTNNWFISTRGRVLGWITVANALSAVMINILTRITEMCIRDRFKTHGGFGTGRRGKGDPERDAGAAGGGQNPGGDSGAAGRSQSAGPGLSGGEYCQGTGVQLAPIERGNCLLQPGRSCGRVRTAGDQHLCRGLSAQRCPVSSGRSGQICGGAVGV